jgi:hypothetical protein
MRYERVDPIGIVRFVSHASRVSSRAVDHASGLKAVSAVPHKSVVMSTSGRSAINRCLLNGVAAYGKHYLTAVMRSLIVISALCEFISA